MSSCSHSSSEEEDLKLRAPISLPANKIETLGMTSEEIPDFLMEDPEANFFAVEKLLSLLLESMNRVHEGDFSGMKGPAAEGAEGNIHHQSVISPNHTARSPRPGAPCNCGDYHPILVPEPKLEMLPPNAILNIVFEALGRNWLTEERKMDLISKVPRVTVFGIKETRPTVQGVFHKLTKIMFIVCSCHGNMFTLDQFVSHAGGSQEEAENPWSFINVV